MPAYSGTFQYRDEKGNPLMMGPCQLRFDAESCTVTPASGAPLAFDLGDVDRLVTGEMDLQLALYTGRAVQLRKFGNLFSQMADELTAAWRDRTVRCMLLEDLEEVMHCPGAAALGANPAGRAEIRLYRSNLAVLPAGGDAFQWRLADVDAVSFDEAAYSITLKSGSSRLVLSKLARKTDELLGELRAALDTLRTESACALHGVFPFLDADRLQRLLTVMPEGRTVRLASLAAVHPKLPEALLKHAVDAHLKPYFDALRSRAVADSLMAGFKFVRQDEAAALGEETPEGEGAEPVPDEAPGGPLTAGQVAVDSSGNLAPSPRGRSAEDVSTEGGEEKPPLFFWFFFPMAQGNMVAWEATTGTGRATYFFRAEQPVESAVERITRGLALVNFRREPVYLSDESLERQPRFHRYAIGSRKLPDLRALRSAMLGRALHSTLEKWTAQVQAIAGR